MNNCLLATNFNTPEEFQFITKITNFNGDGIGVNWCEYKKLKFIITGCYSSNTNYWHAIKEVTKDNLSLIYQDKRLNDNKAPSLILSSLSSSDSNAFVVVFLYDKDIGFAKNNKNYNIIDVSIYGSN